MLLTCRTLSNRRTFMCSKNKSVRILALPVLVLFSAMLTYAQQTNLPDKVSVLFTAVDKNNLPVKLRKEDVRVLEDGVPQEIVTFQQDSDQSLSLALLFDVSESQINVLPSEKLVARAFVNAIIRSEKDKATVISFAGKSELEENLTSDTMKLREAINRVNFKTSPESLAREKRNAPALPVDQDPASYTSTWDAVSSTSSEVLSQAPQQTRRAIILLSDGDDTSSKLTEQKAIDSAIKADVTVYCVGIGDKSLPYSLLKTDALRKMAERTGGRAFFPKSVIELQDAFAQIEQDLRVHYFITYSPSNRKFDGKYHQVRIEFINPELRKRKVQLVYRRGYFAKGVVPYK